MSSLAQSRLAALDALSNHPEHTATCIKIIDDMDDGGLRDVAQEALNRAHRGGHEAALFAFLSVANRSEGRADATSGSEASASPGLSVTPDSTPGPTRQVATNKRGADDDESSPRKRCQMAEDSSDAVEDGNVIGNDDAERRKEHAKRHKNFVKLYNAYAEKYHDYAERYYEDAKAKGYTDEQRRMNWVGGALHLMLSAAREGRCSLSSTSTVKAETTYDGDELVKAETSDSWPSSANLHRPVSDF